MNELILVKTRCVSVCPFSQGIFGLRFNIKTVYFKYGVCIIKIRRSWDRIIFIIGIHILLRRHRYIKTPGLDIYQRCYHLLKVIRFWCMIWCRIRLHFDGIAKLYDSCLEIRRYETGCLGLALSKYFTRWKMPTSPYNYTRTFQQAVRKWKDSYVGREREIIHFDGLVVWTVFSHNGSRSDFSSYVQ